MWLYCWNSAYFGNLHLQDAVAHLPQYASLFQCHFFKGVASMLSYFAGTICIPGINNVDCMAQVDHQLKGQFTSMRMMEVARQLGVTPKGDHPPKEGELDDEFMRDLLEYNMQDCTIVRDIWDRLMIEPLMVAECTSMGVCFHNMSRYITGWMCQSSMDMYCLS